jgi:hypothetical protein
MALMQRQILNIASKKTKKNAGPNNIPMSDYNTHCNTILQRQDEISMTTTIHFNYNTIFE